MIHELYIRNNRLKLKKSKKKQYKILNSLKKQHKKIKNNVEKKEEGDDIIKFIYKYCLFTNLKKLNFKNHKN